MRNRLIFLGCYSRSSNLSWMLRDYSWYEKEFWKLQREHRSQKHWKERVEKLRKDSDNWRYLYREQGKLYQTLKGRLAISESNCMIKPKKKKRHNDIGLKIIDGGQKVEEQPPFAISIASPA